MESNANPYRVLLLEDEPIIGRAISRTLVNQGFTVDIAINGLIAKEKVDAHNDYEFLIFDVKTPVINGIQLYEYLEQKHPELSERVIFTTGDCMGDGTRQFLDRVNRPCLSKPYTPAQLINLIRNVFIVSAFHP